jgi:hypothetical protein
MSYRRVRSYRRRDARRFRSFEEKPRGRRAAMAGLLAVALAAGIGLLSAPHLRDMLSASSSSAGACAPSAAAAPAGTATSPGAAAPAVVDGAAVADSGAPSAPATPTPAGMASSSAAAPAATTPAAPDPSTASTAPAPAPDPTTSAPAPTAAPAQTTSAAPTPCPSSTAPASPSAAAAPAANMDCVIIVPARPLTARGLATPYQLTGADGTSPDASGCTMANSANLGAFVQATILNPATGALSVYEPLVITAGTTPAAAPVVPKLPRHAIVTIDFGFNGTNLTQAGATPRALSQGHCVNGLPGSIFGQVSFCHGTAFFRAARRAERRHKLVVPSAGTSPATGQACPTTRDFTIVDQDPSDNVTTKYLLTATGQTAQLNGANTAALPGATTISNGSDNALLDGFMDPALGCKPFTAPDLSQDGTPGTSQALDELSAARSQAAPVALVPANDEMVLVGSHFSMAKTNLYRSNVGQPAISPGNNKSSSPAKFCQDMVNIQTPFLNANQALLAAGPSPVPSVGTNLFTFMANRLSMSFANLNCQNFGLKNPVSVTLDGNGVATAATFDTTQQVASGGYSGGGPRRRHGRHHHWLMNPSQM